MRKARNARRGTTVVAVAVLAVGLATSAAAQTTTTAPAAPTPPAAGATRGVTATSIRVGGISDSLLYGGADVGAKARFQRANDAGGVNGRTIEYLGVTDDGGDPTADANAAKKLVEQDGVFAVVPTVTPDLSASSYLTQQRVPYFGWALSSNFCGSSYGFGFTGCPFAKHATSNAWPLHVAKVIPNGAAGHAVAIVTEGTPTGQYDAGALSAAATSVKFRIAYAKASLGVPVTPDYGAVAKEVLTSNNGTAPDAVFVVGGISNVVGMQQALAAAGFLGIFTNQLQYDPGLVAPAVGAFVPTQTAPTESAADNPAMKQLVADVQKIAPDQPIDQSVIAGYWSADLFLSALQKAGKKLTAASLVHAANAKFTYRVPNTVGPTTFPAAHALPTPCGALVQSSGTAYVVKAPYACGRVVPVE
ncbi:MAG TPA: ABC transporter substrate-binding protein [Acidimicrobiia bacterium]|nr:ABC transporter substrate-binding protein [Acidimicrobiia bacterium]